MQAPVKDWPGATWKPRAASDAPGKVPERLSATVCMAGAPGLLSVGLCGTAAQVVGSGPLAQAQWLWLKTQQLKAGPAPPAESAAPACPAVRCQGNSTLSDRQVLKHRTRTSNRFASGDKAWS